MMRRALPRVPRAQVCQLCELLYMRNTRPAKRTLVTLCANQVRVGITQQFSSRPVASRPLGRSTSTSTLQHRWARNTKDKTPSEASESQNQRQQAVSVADLESLAAAVDRVTKAFLAQQGIPSEKTTYDALRACAQADTKLLVEAESPAEGHKDGESHLKTSASHLLDMDSSTKKTTAKEPKPTIQTPAFSVQDLVDIISAAAHTIIKHPSVIITPRLLAEYVKIQARLGKAETLPEVFNLYRSKPLPRMASGSLRLEERNPDKMDRPLNTSVVEEALDAAIEAKNIDAAVGIVANTYATKAFTRSKLINKVIIPGTVLGVVPVAAYVLASNFSLLQNSMDQGMATGIAFAAILGYVAFTGAIGMVVITTSNDQMRRVTWLPGMPLRERFLREEERAALDKVACAFGFTEKHRWGEETGADFEALREYILGKGMILDAVELMEGMN